MLSFRKKILISDFVLFFIFIILLFPFVEHTVNYIVRTSLNRRAIQEIAKLEMMTTQEEMVESLSQERAFIFFRVTLFDEQVSSIYDTHKIDTIEKGENQEIEQALKKGQSFQNKYSNYFGQSMAYASVAFDAAGHRYVLRIGLPFAEIRSLMVEFEVGFIILGIAVLLLYGIVTWAIMHRLSLPISHITNVLSSYQEGKEEFVPRIELGKEIQAGDEFGKLAKTLNAMTSRIRKQIDSLIQQRRETEAILESLGEGVLAMDSEEQIFFSNRVAFQMLAIKQDNVLQKRFLDLKVDRQGLAKKCYELFRSSFEQSKIVSESYILEEGAKLYFNVIAAPLARHRGIVLVLQDKTSDYKMLEMGKDFIANASHELRTPLTILRGFAETLQDLPELSQETLKEITEKILKTSIRLELLVKSLLTLTDIEGLRENQIHSVDLVLLSDSCIKNLQETHPQAQVSLQSKIDDARVEGDPALLEMAVMNLLENAVRYSPVPARITITINRSGEWTFLSISDRGVGISAQDLPHIFDRFYTIDKARSRKFGGAGLGLSIVKAIMQKHSGEISVVSKLGQGTTFTLRLKNFEDVSTSK